MPTVFFIMHPDVAIDPHLPVPDWPLNDRGRMRMGAMTAQPWASGVRRIFASSERKARDAAQILAEGLRLGGYSVVDDLRENDRSATGYLSKQEFEATADSFFAHPQESVHGWEPALVAEARIVCAIEEILSGGCRTGRSGHSRSWRHGNIALLPSRGAADRSPVRPAGDKWRKLVRL